MEGAAPLNDGVKYKFCLENLGGSDGKCFEASSARDGKSKVFLFCSVGLFAHLFSY